MVYEMSNNVAGYLKRERGKMIITGKIRKDNYCSSGIQGNG